MAWSRQYSQCISCGTTSKRHYAKGLCVTCYFRALWSKRGKNPSQTWSDEHSNCVACGTTAVPHEARGLCRACYYKSHFKVRIEHDPNLLDMLPREELLRLYVHEELSLREIVRLKRISKDAVRDLIKWYEIPLRSKRHGRGIALAKGNVKSQRRNEDGTTRQVTHTQLEINRDFFFHWSDSFAYVLGFLFTDGALQEWSKIGKQATPYRICQISITQKEPLILEQIREAISLNKPIMRLKNNKDSYKHMLAFRHAEIFDRLVSLGLTPNKSLTVAFPQIPGDYLRGFLRGLFDGDGSFYGGNARLTTGSQVFASGVKAALTDAGFSSTITVTPASEKRKNPSYTIRVSTANHGFEKFVSFLYEGATLFLPRKHQQCEEWIDQKRLKQASYPTIQF